MKREANILNNHIIVINSSLLSFLYFLFVVVSFENIKKEEKLKEESKKK